MLDYRTLDNLRTILAPQIKRMRDVGLALEFAEHVASATAQAISPQAISPQ